VTAQDRRHHRRRPAGVFHGVQSLRQLLPPDLERFGWRADGGRVTVPAVEIEDQPRFSWRGAMLDVSRHFSPVAEVKKFIDLLALHKFSVFHWHLVDDQGWRVEIKKYPKLTEIGAWREKTVRPSSGGHPRHSARRFLHAGELRDVVAYAAERAITVVPEIEMPGHSSAALAAYPELGCTDAPGYNPQVQPWWGIFPETYAPKPATLQFLDDVLTRCWRSSRASSSTSAATRR
jgi:hexosaminidase